MKKISTIVLTILALLSTNAFARDDIGNYSIVDALSSGQGKSDLGSDIKFYFGQQKHGKVLNDMGTFKVNHKTNAFNKSDKEACDWVFLGAMKTLKARALKEGGNAIIDIQSNYKNHLTSSEKTYQCGAGTFIAGVALTGKVVKIN